jgi:hypothetical protein
MDIKTILTDLRAERDRIDQVIAAMEALIALKSQASPVATAAVKEALKA